MATRKQIAAAKKNIKKAIVAKKHKEHKHKRRA